MPPCSAPTHYWQTRASGLATSPLGVVVRCINCGFFFFFSSWLCCPLWFQNSPQTCQWEGFLVFGNFSSFTTPSPGRVSVPNSFIFCPTSFWREWAAFLGAWCPPPAFRSCFVEFVQHSNDFSMNLWGRKWSPHPIPSPSSLFKNLFKISYTVKFAPFCLKIWVLKRVMFLPPQPS